MANVAAAFPAPKEFGITRSASLAPLVASERLPTIASAAGKLRFHVGSALQVQAIQHIFGLAREIPRLAHLPANGREAGAESENFQLSVWGGGSGLQFLLDIGVSPFAPVERSQVRMGGRGGPLVLNCCIERSACFLNPVQARIGRGHLPVAIQHVGIELHGALCLLQRVVELAELVIDDRQIVEGGGIPRVGLDIEFVGGNALVELAAVRIIMGHDVELLALAGPIPKLESLLPVLFRQLGLPKVVVDVPRRA